MSTLLKISIALTLGCLSTVAHADTVALRRSVRMRQPDPVVRLADVARLEGEHVSLFGQLEVARFENRVRPLELNASDIARQLEAAGANPAQFDFVGARVIVRPFSGVGAPELGTALRLDRPTLAVEDSPKATAKALLLQVHLDPQEVIGEDTIRGLLAARFAPQWRTLQVDSRLAIMTPSNELLSESNTRPRLQVVKKAADGTITFDCTHNGESAGRITVQLEALSLVHRLRKESMRGAALSDSQITTHSEWNTIAAHRQHALMPALLGGTIEKRLAADTVLAPAHFAPVVHRNAPIRVTSGGSGFALELECIALAAGRIGETIDVRTNAKGLSARAQRSRPIRVVIKSETHAVLAN